MHLPVDIRCGIMSAETFHQQRTLSGRRRIPISKKEPMTSQKDTTPPPKTPVLSDYEKDDRESAKQIASAKRGQTVTRRGSNRRSRNRPRSRSRNTNRTTARARNRSPPRTGSRTVTRRHSGRTPRKNSRRCHPRPQNRAGALGLGPGPRHHRIAPERHEFANRSGDFSH
jgi:hypothetical protein